MSLLCGRLHGLFPSQQLEKELIHLHVALILFAVLFKQNSAITAVSIIMSICLSVCWCKEEDADFFPDKKAPSW